MNGERAGVGVGLRQYQSDTLYELVIHCRAIVCWRLCSL